MSLLSVPAKPATTTRLGTVRTSATEDSPIVMTQAATEAALADKASLDDLAAVEATATAATAAAGEAVAEATSASGTAAAAAAEASAAASAADAALAAAAAFPVDDFRGTLLTLATDPGVPAEHSGKWWQSGVAGTLTHTNAAGAVVNVGDRLLSDGATWLVYASAPAYFPANSIPGSKLAEQTVPPSKLSNATRDLMVRSYADASEEAVVGWATDGDTPRVALGIDADGNLKFAGQTYGPQDLGTDFPDADTDYVWGWFTRSPDDGLYRTILAITDSGEVKGPLGQLDNDKLLAGEGETLTRLAPSLQVSNVQEIDGGSAFRFFAKDGLNWVPYRAGRSGNGIRPRYQPADINHILLYGQSNATRAGNEAGTNNALTTTPSGRHLMFGAYVAGSTSDPGLQAPQSEADSAIYRVGSIDDFAPLYEGKGTADDGETMASGIIGTLDARLGWKCLASGAAVGGYTVAQLAQGQWPYLNLLYQVTRAKELADAMGVTYKVAAIPFIQGEANSTTTTWHTQVITLSEALNEDIKEITGQREDIILIVEQMNRPVWEEPQNVDLSILQAHHGDGGRIYWQSPRYHHLMAAHYYPHGKRWRGCHIGETIASILGDDAEWEGLRLKSYAVSGGDLFLRFYTPTPPLRFATSENVTLLSGYGFEASGLDEVEQVSDQGLRLTNTGSWTGILLKYARQSGLGAQKGNLTDSGAAVAVYNDADGDPYPLNNWCAAFELQL